MVNWFAVAGGCSYNFVRTYVKEAFYVIPGAITSGLTTFILTRIPNLPTLNL